MVRHTWSQAPYPDSKSQRQWKSGQSLAPYDRRIKGEDWPTINHLMSGQLTLYVWTTCSAVLAVNCSTQSAGFTFTEDDIENSPVKTVTKYLRQKPAIKHEMKREKCTCHHCNGIFCNNVHLQKHFRSIGPEIYRRYTDIQKIFVYLTVKTCRDAENTRRNNILVIVSLLRLFISSYFSASVMIPLSAIFSSKSL